MGLKYYLKIMRLFNSFMSGIGVVFTALLCSGYALLGVENIYILLLGFYTGFSVTAVCMVINDIIDEKVDRVNKPWKPLPMGYVDRKLLVTISVAMITSVLFLNALANTWLFIVTSIYSVIGISYSMLRKHWWSQLLVALSTTGPIIYGYVLFVNTGISTLIAMFSTTIFLVTLGREILKAIQDIEGDKKYGYETIPIKTGVGRARIIMIIVAITGVVLGILTGVIANTNALYMVLITASGIYYLYYIGKVYKEISVKETLEEARRKTLISMMMGLLAFWISKI